MNGFQRLAQVLNGGSRPGVQDSVAAESGVRLELATVVTAPPDLSIKIDGINLTLTKEFLVVAQHLLNDEAGNTREVSLEFIANQSQGYFTNAEYPYETTRFKPDVGPEGTAFRDWKLLMRDTLKPGDRVIVASSGSVYFILDKAVVL